MRFRGVAQLTEVTPTDARKQIAANAVGRENRIILLVIAAVLLYVGWEDLRD